MRFRQGRFFKGEVGLDVVRRFKSGTRGTQKAGGRRDAASTGLDRSISPSSCAYFSPANASQDTFGFQFVNVPLGLVFHAQTCRV